MIDTHYIYRPTILDASAFDRLVDDVRALLDQKPPTLLACGFDGTGRPNVSRNEIAINGDESVGGDHEPLVIQRVATRSREREGIHFEFCKTNGKPYDVIVVAVLYAFLNRFPACKFVSDSSITELKLGFDLFFNACHPTGNVQRLYRRPVGRSRRGFVMITPEQLAERMKVEILNDVRDGIVPLGVGSFSELHDFVDANLYGGTEVLLEELDSVAPDTDEGHGRALAALCNLCNPAMMIVDVWIKEGGIDAMLATQER